MSDSEAWHLPEFMRDFHDQKDVFRSVDSWDARNRTADERKRYPLPNWVDAHVYTVDSFLRFMAEHGYTLQRCRRDLEFRDITETMKRDSEDRRTAAASLVKELMTKSD